MSQSVVAGTGFQISNTQCSGGMNAHAMGNSFSMAVQTGEGEVTVSLMFQINGQKEYSTITVTNEVHNQAIPVGATYLEFNLQGGKITSESAYFRIDIWKNA